MASLFKKSGKAKRNLAIFMIAFLALLAAAVIDPGSQQEMQDIGDASPNQIEASNDTQDSINGNNVESGEMLEVHFIDVGQGDATLLLGPDFKVLIDAGRHDRNDVVPYLKSVGVEELDLVVGTHPHADHIGQLDKVLKEFRVTEVWMSGDSHTSKTFERVLDAILDSQVNYNEPRSGETYKIGSTTIEVLNPNALTGDFHEGSIAVRIVFEEIAIVFTGDVEAPVERQIIIRGHNLKAQIIQLGHHGSTTSNSREFLDIVKPEIAIYSAGEDNSYGHPHQEIIQRLQGMGIGIYGTDVDGTIVIITDGKTYDVKVKGAD